MNKLSEEKYLEIEDALKYHGGYPYLEKGQGYLFYEKMDKVTDFMSGNLTNRITKITNRYLGEKKFYLLSQAFDYIHEKELKNGN